MIEPPDMNAMRLLIGPWPKTSEPNNNHNNNNNDASALASICSLPTYSWRNLQSLPYRQRFNQARMHTDIATWHALTKRGWTPHALPTCGSKHRVHLDAITKSLR